jgi:putative PIN family toxin of toxin-antitoxin system
VIAVADTNVLVSGLLFGGPPGAVIEAAVEGTYTLALSATILAELEGVLLRAKFGLHEELVRTLVRDIESVAVVFYPSKSHQVVEDDPADNAIVDCAVEAKANYVVSGDRHLLSLGLTVGIPVVAPSRFLEIIGIG